jgi:hypothetical protein
LIVRAVVAIVLLCGLAVPARAAEEPERAADGRWPEWLAPLRVRGRLAEEFAYRLHDPGDESKLKTLGWLEAKYAFNESLSLRVATRAWYDAVFDVTDRYPDNVRRDQQTEVSLREAVLAFSRGDFDVRVGRQQIVWGEAIGTFITDVVNPKDFREFILPEFTELRIPIWALDFTYRLAPNVTFEGVWTPDTMSNRLAKKGAEYQFTPPAYRFPGPVVRLPDDLDEFSLDRSEGGFRLSALREGWDMSLIYYDTADKSPVNFQSRVPNPPGPPITVLQPKHPRLHIVGATLAKSLEPVVLRAEAALTIGKRYATTNPLDLDGVVRRDTIDWLVGVDYTFFGLIDTALQINQKILTGSATNLTQPGVEGQATTQLTLRVGTGLFDNTLNPTILFAVNANRADLRLSPRLDWLVTGSVTMSVGFDIFQGHQQTLYGQFDHTDRVTFTTTWRF